MDNVKERVKALCKANGITVQQLEKEIGLSNGTISKWDRYNPRMDKLTLVATFFSVPAESLMGGELPGQKENPVNFDVNEEYEDAILRGQSAYFLSLFQRLTPAQKDQTISEILQKLQNQ